MLPALWIFNTVTKRYETRGAKRRSKLLYPSLANGLRLNGLLKSNRVSLYRVASYPILLERFTFVVKRYIYICIYLLFAESVEFFSETFPPLKLIILGESSARGKAMVGNGFQRWALVDYSCPLLVKSGSTPLRRIFAGGEYVTSPFLRWAEIWGEKKGRKESTSSNTCNKFNFPGVERLQELKIRFPR